MIKTFSIFLSFVVFCAAQPAFADSDKSIELTKEFTLCIQKSGGITSEILDCNGAEQTREDVRLNKVYKELMAVSSPQNRTRLQAAQRAWIKYRETNCAYVADSDSGSAGGINSSSCFLEATASRAKELEAFKEYEYLKK